MADTDPDPDPQDPVEDVHDTTGKLHKDPGDTTPPVDPAAEGVGEGDVDAIAENERQIQAQKARDTVTRYQNHTQPMWEKYKALLAEDQQMHQQMSQQELSDLQQQPQAPQRQKNDWTQAMSELFAVAIPIALAFGLRGNGFAKGAMMSALGSAMTAFAKGQEVEGKRAMADYRAQVSAINQSNKERHQIYKDILANQKLALEDQFKMIEATAQEFQDPHMINAAKAHHMPSVVKQLENQERIAKRFAKGADKSARLVEKKPSRWADYKEHMIDEYDIDPDQNPEEARKTESYDKWRMKHFPSKAESGKPGEEEKTDSSNPLGLNLGAKTVQEQGTDSEGVTGEW